MNLQPLFTTARVITAVYRIASTTLLLLYLAQRVSDGRKISRSRRVDNAGAYRSGYPSHTERKEF
jgi:hypothetical protein